ncbi:MAG TPA: hypothetical protein VI197_23765 [Polyangiaceae bacterium]
MAKEPTDSGAAPLGGRIVETRASDRDLAEEAELPPVVARMVVEIRSDGSRTVARGALEDIASGERVALRADGSTPLALASALAKSLLKTPLFAKQAVLALLQPRRGRR